MTVGIATFVKTPGLTPLKTRLAAGIGSERAEVFYQLSCRAIAEVLQTLPSDFQPYWAVAEAHQEHYWPDFPNLWQGSGGLAPRLDKIYRSLLEKHDVAILIGADCPHISQELIVSAARTCKSQSRFVMGPARDGGFYLFAGQHPIPYELWDGVPYSAAETGRKLADSLFPIAGVEYLIPLTDVDTIDDLPQMIAEMQKPLTTGQELLRTTFSV